ncbi:MAG: NADP oxidoreductase [Chloroflexi bacterium]|nr:MAG: bidirectional hydrogenase subunit Y [Chloroflexi bacterium OLB13]MBC6954904.1 NADP oxidoreductase [Chloroflexota bacterium]MBV6437458.1 NAD-reducing hydrogenase HoxS subunit delta [Anaerolineae bacterium]MDL1914735.1 NADP oxidoreductase [Anaerolineae bacterium CFX4]OQY84667.1 MAG: NADP oxidoreductase [Anaerolineae bacterium UTCFX5]
MTRTKIATVWLDGCSGCHMSFLDIDGALLDLADRIDLVYSPLVDRKDFPDSVDITLVEGAVSSEDDLAKIRKVRAHTRTLVAFGDCAVTGNVPALRNSVGAESVLRRVYLEPDLHAPQVPNLVVPALLNVVKPVHAVVPVDVFIPGCPPSAKTILYALTELLDGRMPDLSNRTRFGA